MSVRIDHAAAVHQVPQTHVQHKIIALTVGTHLVIWACRYPLGVCSFFLLTTRYIIHGKRGQKESSQYHRLCLHVLTNKMIDKGTFIIGNQSGGFSDAYPGRLSTHDP